MDSLEDELAEHLSGKSPPFLFVGAGMSRRYVGLDSWDGLLRRFAAVTEVPYDRYYSDAEGDFPSIATAVAKNFNPIWWENAEYEPHRTAFEGRLANGESPLKVEVASLMAGAVEQLDLDGEHAEELAALKKATVSGIITTNYDSLLEHLFPDFRSYVGQEQLLFSEVQSVGEIYKIHGSHETPDSLVLTRSDYDVFETRNPYLAAKLMTIFVDHPIVFLGYRMGDRNVTKILNAIAAPLNNDHLAKLADRLVFVSRDEKASDPRLGHGSFATDGGNIPMRTVGVADYAPIYRALGRTQRQLPAPILRQLKERVYELVLTSDPVGALKVVNIEDAVGDMDVVFGVGAVDRLNSLGYFGVDRKKLIEDVLLDEGNFDAGVVVTDVIPKLPPQGKFTPVMKYLRGAGLLSPSGELRSPKELDQRLRDHVAGGRSRFGPTADHYKKADRKLAKKVKSFTKLVAQEDDPKVVVRVVHALKDSEIDLAAFRQYLVDHRDDFAGSPSDRTLFAKAVCLLDWLLYAKE